VVMVTVVGSRKFPIKGVIAGSYKNQRIRHLP
jgi:hypothetical protein